MEQPQQKPVDPVNTSVGYVPPQQFGMDPVMSKHLDSSEILEQLKYMLLGQEYDEIKDEWKPAMYFVGYNDEGKALEAEQGPLMEPKDVTLTISYLRMFLNSNTFLSTIDENRINDIMWDVNTKLGVLFYNLRHKLTPEAIAMVWGMIEYPILLGLSRAQRKITLDALSKTQQTHEIIQSSPTKQGQPEEKFKAFGGF